MSGAGTRSAYGSAPSAPDRMRSARAESRTVLVRGPTCMYRSSTSGQWPVSGMRPWVAFSPTRPQWLAGWRIDPPTSLPIPRGDMPLDTAAASPPLEPPVVRVSSHGFLVVPNMRLPVSHHRANSGRFVFAIITPPASSSRVTTVASFSGHVVGEYERAARGPGPRRIDAVLDGEGDAVERAPRLAPHGGGLGLPGALHRPVYHGHDRVQLRVEGVDPLQAGGQHLDRREAFLVYALSQSARVEGQQGRRSSWTPIRGWSQLP